MDSSLELSHSPRSSGSGDHHLGQEGDSGEHLFGGFELAKSDPSNAGGFSVFGPEFCCTAAVELEVPSVLTEDEASTVAVPLSGPPPPTFLLQAKGAGSNKLKGRLRAADRPGHVLCFDHAPNCPPGSAYRIYSGGRCHSSFRVGGVKVAVLRGETCIKAQLRGLPYVGLVISGDFERGSLKILQHMPGRRSERLLASACPSPAAAGATRLRISAGVDTAFAVALVAIALEATARGACGAGGGAAPGTTSPIAAQLSASSATSSFSASSLAAAAARVRGQQQPAPAAVWASAPLSAPAAMGAVSAPLSAPLPPPLWAPREVPTAPVWQQPADCTPRVVPSIVFPQRPANVHLQQQHQQMQQQHQQMQMPRPGGVSPLMMHMQQVQMQQALAAREEALLQQELTRLQLICKGGGPMAAGGAAPAGAAAAALRCPQAHSAEGLASGSGSGSAGPFGGVYAASSDSSLWGPLPSGNGLWSI